MARLMSSNSWPVPDAQMALFTVLKDGMNQLETTLQSAEAALDTDTRKFATDVEQRVPRLRKEVTAQRCCWDSAPS